MRITIDTGDNEQSPTEVTSKGVAATAGLMGQDGGPAAHSTGLSHMAAATAPADAMTVYDAGATKAEFDALVAATGDDLVSQVSGGEHKDLHGPGGERALDGGPAPGKA